MAASQELDRSLLHGIAWTGGLRWIIQILSWALTLLIARLLTPTDYGLFGMAMVYIGLMQIVGDGGLMGAIIQQRDLSREQLARLGGLVVALGALLCLITAAMADTVAGFFAEREVRVLLWVLSLTFLLRGFNVLPRALLTRELQFRRLAVLDSVEGLVLMGTTLALALLGFGHWALVGATVISCVVTTVLLLTWRPHPLAWPRDLATLRDPIVLGMHLVLSQGAWYAYTNADFAVVGRVLGSAALGAYGMAWTIASIPVERISGLVGRVTPAFFAAVQNDQPALRRYLHRLTEGLALVTVPASVGLALVAKDFVRVMLGENWLPATAPLRLLALYAAFRSVAMLAPQVMVATGQAKRSMQFSVLAALVLPAVFYFGTRWGTTGVALGWVIVYPAIAALFIRSMFRTIGMRGAEYLGALRPALGGTAAMTAAVLGLQIVLPDAWPAVIRLAAQATLGAATYVIVILSVNGDRIAAFRNALRVSGIWRGRVPTPIHATTEIPSRPRLLLVSYHFPPGQATGALRWQKLAGFAAERGWGLDVVALHPASLSAADPGRLSELPPGVRIYGVREPVLALEVINRWIARLLRWRLGRRIGARATRSRRGSLGWRDFATWRPHEPRDLARAYFAWLDYIRERRWARAAASLAVGVVEPGSHRAVISCGPPHLAHEAGRQIATATSLPFVMDLRDPWSLVQRLPEAIASPVWRALARRHERQAVERAALIVSNTEALGAALQAAYPAAADRVVTVTNGFDDEAIPPTQSGHRFTIGYAGAIYLDRDPRPIFRAAARVVREAALTPDDFGIEFMGAVECFDGQTLEAIAREEGLENYLRLYPLAPRPRALDFLARAQLLITLPQDSDMAIPAKVFDYVRFDSWILALADRGSATERLLRETDADVVAPSDLDAMTAVLHRRLAQHRRGERPHRIAEQGPFSRRAQAEVLFDAIERVAATAEAQDEVFVRRPMAVEAAEAAEAAA